MGNLFASLHGAANALTVFERGLTVAQNNVANASTPGYAKQIQSYKAMPFDPAQSVGGGVAALPVESARDQYSELAVQRQLSTLGMWDEQVNSLSPLQLSFDMTGTSGIPGALSELYQSFSDWSVTPTDGTARQNVINAAGQVSEAFHQTANAVAQAAAQTDTQLGTLVDQVNALARQIRDYNVQAGANGGGQNAALEAGMYSTLEQLSELVPISVLKNEDGSFNVSMNGQTALVVGQYQYDIDLEIAVPTTPAPTYAGPPPQAQLFDASGNEITLQTTGGRLGGLLQTRNTVLASLLGDNTQPGDLNRLAAAIADRTTTILTGGNITDGPPAVPGVPLFTYDPLSPSTAAQKLSVAAKPADLAAIKPATATDPEVSNGIALQLANLESSQDPLDRLDNLSYTGFYGDLAGRVGRALSTAQSNRTTQQDVVTQARSLRQATSGVSLDEEAINVLELQRSYQAASKMITVLNELTKTVVDLV